MYTGFSLTSCCMLSLRHDTHTKSSAWNECTIMQSEKLQECMKGRSIQLVETAFRKWNIYSTLEVGLLYKEVHTWERSDKPLIQAIDKVTRRDWQRKSMTSQLSIDLYQMDLYTLPVALCFAWHMVKPGIPEFRPEFRMKNLNALRVVK